MENLLEKYGYFPDNEEIDSALERIAAGLDAFNTEDVLKACFSMMDLTSLKTNDTPASIAKLVGKVNNFSQQYPDYQLPASICVYSNFASVIKELRNTPEVHATVVSACFPSAQSFLEVKTLEARMAVEQGADEVDIVLALNSFLAGDYVKASNEIRQVRKTVDEAAAAQGRKVILKVILETGLLTTAENIANASFLAIEAGADFIKTSTGKVEVNATPFAAYIMCQCIRKYYEATGREIGFKPAGGMTTAKDALTYYSIVASVLGKKWLDKNHLRFGVSRLGNSLLSEIEHKTVTFF
ncbi:MAG: deoxyribose-phosphate aldolase [Bacteroidales bacterium]|nr:deoxyribose-phosphate aldolase [Bacteroidales bacterium]